MQLRAFNDDNRTPSKGSIEALVEAFDTIENAVMHYKSDKLWYSLAVLRNSILTKDAGEQWKIPYLKSTQRSHDESFIKIYGLDPIFNSNLEYHSEKAVDVRLLNYAFEQVREALNRYYTPELDYSVEVLRNGLLSNFEDSKQTILSEEGLKRVKKYIQSMRRPKG